MPRGLPGSQEGCPPRQRAACSHTSECPDRSSLKEGCQLRQEGCPPRQEGCPLPYKRMSRQIQPQGGLWEWAALLSARAALLPGWAALLPGWAALLPRWATSFLEGRQTGGTQGNGQNASRAGRNLDILASWHQVGWPGQHRGTQGNDQNASRAGRNLDILASWHQLGCLAAGWAQGPGPRAQVPGPGPKGKAQGPGPRARAS